MFSFTPEASYVGECRLSATHSSFEAQEHKRQTGQSVDSTTKPEDLEFQVDQTAFTLDPDGQCSQTFYLRESTAFKVRVRHATHPFEFTQISGKEVLRLLTESTPLKHSRGTLHFEVTTKAEALGYARRRVMSWKVTFTPNPAQGVKQNLMSLFSAFLPSSSEAGAAGQT